MRSLGQALIIAAAYFATGKLGLLLAIPPGYATAVWLPSGVALVGVLLFGYRACFGVVLGSFLVNIGISFDSSNADAIIRSSAIAGSIAAGAALQAAAGTFLVRRFVGFPNALDNEREVGKFLALGGPASCLVNASWSVSTLFLAGAVSANDFLFHWWTWWVGDSIGVLIVTPLVLAWIAEPRASWRPRRMAITVPLGIAFALAVVFFIRASQWEQERIRNVFVEQANSIGASLKGSVDRYIEVLHSFRDFYGASQYVSRQEFHDFGAGPLVRYPGFQALSWNPRVTAAERPAWEAELSKEIGAPAAITERDAKGGLVPASPRTEYVAVRYIDPLPQNTAALGYDVSSDPVRAEALMRARDSGGPAATARIVLVQDVRREPGFLVFLPVYRGGTTPGTVQARREHLLGYATGVFRVSDMVAPSVKSVNKAEIQLLLTDGAAPPEMRFLYSDHHTFEQGILDEAEHARAGAHTIEFNVAGRSWLLSVTPTELYLARHRGWQAWTMLAAGFLFSGLLGAFLLVITGRAQRIERLAEGLRVEAGDRRRAEARVRRLNRLYAIQSAINSLSIRVRDRDELYRETCRIAVDEGKFRFAWVGAVDRGEMLVKPVAYSGEAQSFLSATADRYLLIEGGPLSLVAQAINAKEVTIANDVANDPRILFKQEHAQLGVQSLGVLPFIVSGEAIGALVLHAEERNFFDEEEIALLREMAGDIGFALGHLEKEEKLNYLAYYDPLTGLANRTLFLDRLRQGMSAVENERRKLAVAVFDLERFKMINDSFGMRGGDELLKQVANRFSIHWPEANSVARVGADEFAVVWRGSKSDEDLVRVESHLNRLFGTPFNIGGQECRVAAKVGIALYPSDGVDADTVFGNAESALKRAKRTGEHYLFYLQEMNTRVAEKLSLENKLRQALEREEFVLHYQPKINLETGDMTGVEALIRWQSPELGLVPPMRFIPLLEETGLILEVGSWALMRASRDHRNWVEANLRAPRVAVNVSAIQLRQKDFVRMVEQAIIGDVSPTGIDLEITESLIMDDIHRTMDKLKDVRQLGIDIAIDDFGTGYSSLAYLAKLPVQSLKIDRSFTITMLKEVASMTLVRTIIELAHALNLTVIAEGVDSDEQAKALKLLRCDEMQGYIFSKPLPLEQMTALLKPKVEGV